MPVFINPENGQKFNNDRPDAGELATKWGLVPEAEYTKQKTLDDAGEGTGLQSLGEGIERGVGAMAAGIQSATGFGTAPGLVDNEQGEQLPGGGLSSLQNAYTPEADLRRQAHPVLSGIGQGIGLAPAVAAAGALGAAALPAEVPLVGGALGGVLGEAATGATQQEYDDSWFEKRPMEASNVAAYTLMFAGGDLLFRGVGKAGLALGKRLLYGAEPTATSLGGRNLVSEAQGAARDAADVAPKGGGGSVGAAAASDLVEPFDQAIRTMSEKDAAVLARDANDHLHLVSQDASEAMTRVNQGLSDNLGSQLKYEDFATNAQDWDAPLLERQSGWLDEMTNKGDDIARQLAGGGKPGQLDYGNLGKKAAQIIDTFNQRITEEADPARRNYLTDSVKKQLDGLTNSIDSSFGVDQVTRTDLKNIIRPFREELREGLMNPKYWGKNADMQRALNGPWTQLLEHWSKVQQTLLEATGHTQFDQMGAGRITKESTVDRMRALFSKDPRANQEMGKHLAGAFDGLQGLVEARQAHGIANTDGLDAMSGDIRNLMEDWNLATTVKVAENRVANLKRDPRKWASLALDLGERLPLVGKPIHVARSLGDAFTDLHLEQGSALGQLWDQGYRRFAQNPALQDPSISANYADWILDALRKRGGNVPVPPAGNMGAPMQAAANEVGAGFRQAAQPAAAEPGMRWTQTAPAESVDDYLRRQAAGRAPAQPIEQSEARGSIFSGPPTAPEAPARPEPSAAAQKIRDTIKRRRSQEGSIRIDLPNRDQPLIDQPLISKDDGTKVSLLDAAKQVAGEVAARGASVWESENIARELFGDDAGRVVDRTLGALRRGRVELEGSPHQPAKMRAAEIRLALQDHYPKLAEDAARLQTPAEPGAGGAEIPGEYDDLAADLQQPPDMKTALAAMRSSISPEGRQWFKKYQSGVGFYMNRDLRSGEDSRYAEWAHDVVGYMHEAINEGATAPGLVERGLKLSADEIEKLKSAKVLTARGVVSTSPKSNVAKRFASASPEAEQASLRRTQGETPVIFQIEQATGVPLSAEEVALRPGTQFKMLGSSERNIGTKAKPVMAPVFRVREIGYKPGAPSDGIIAGGLLGIGTAAALASSNAQAAEPERPPPPAQPPLPAYSGALKEINKAGNAQIQALASSVLRKRDPGTGSKTPIDLFGGRRSLQDSVEGVRQRLEQIANDPAALVQTLSGSVGDLWKTHPTVYGALVEKSTQMANYLHAALPPRTATTLMDPLGGPVSFDRAWDFAAKFVGTVQPKAALREVVRGTAPPEMLEALQVNHPELWDGLRAHMIGMVQRMADAGRHIPSEKLARLDRQFSMDGQLDPSASLVVASHFLAAQDAEAQKRQQTGASGKMPGGTSGAASSFRTPLDAINSERASA